MELQEVKIPENESIKFKMILDEQEVENIRNETYKSIKPNLKIKGFRNGKVPLKTAESMLGIDKLYGGKIYNMLIDSVSNKGYEIYATKDFKVEKDLTCEVIVFPYKDVNFTKDINELCIIKEVAEVTDEEIEASKKNIFYEHSDRIEVPEDYQAKNGDELVVTMTVENLDKNKIVVKDIETEIVLGLNDDGVGKHLEGVRKNEKGVFSIVVNKEEYQYEVFCKEIWKLKAPTEEEILKALRINTMYEVECKIRQKIQEKKQARIEKETFNKVFIILKENSDFVLNPKTLESLVSHIKEEDQKEALKNVVTRNYTQASLLISAAKKLNIKINNSEIDNEIQKMILRGKLKNKNVSNKMRLDIKQRLLEQKAMDILIKKQELHKDKK